MTIARAGTGTEPNAGGLQTITAADSAEVLVSLLLHTDGDLAFLRPDQWDGDAAATVDEVVVRQVAAGRVSRAVYPVRVLEQPPTPVLARAVAGEQIRVLPAVGTRLAVFGASAAVTTALWGSGLGGCVLVRQNGLVRSLRGLFDAWWDRAVAPPDLSRSTVGDERKQLLNLMLQGAIDQQIARATGVSLRTVRRRIAALMDDLGATSRFGAGVEAARRGWL